MYCLQDRSSSHCSGCCCLPGQQLTGWPSRCGPSQPQKRHLTWRAYTCMQRTRLHSGREGGVEDAEGGGGGDDAQAGSIWGKGILNTVHAEFLEQQTRTCLIQAFCLFKTRLFSSATAVLQAGSGPVCLSDNSMSKPAASGSAPPLSSSCW